MLASVTHFRWVFHCFLRFLFVLILCLTYVIVLSSVPQPVLRVELCCHFSPSGHWSVQYHSSASYKISVGFRSTPSQVVSFISFFRGIFLILSTIATFRYLSGDRTSGAVFCGKFDWNHSKQMILALSALVKAGRCKLCMISNGTKSLPPFMLKHLYDSVFLSV